MRLTRKQRLLLEKILIKEFENEITMLGMISSGTIKFPTKKIEKLQTKVTNENLKNIRILFDEYTVNYRDLDDLIKEMEE